MLLLVSLAAACLQSDPCRTVDAYLRALKSMDEDHLEALVDPQFRVHRPDGTERPFNFAVSRGYREFERATHARWTYTIIGIDGERIAALTTEENDFYRALGVGTRTQLLYYSARNGHIYSGENPATVDERGNYLRAYHAFFDWLQKQPDAASDTTLIRDGDLVFNAASAGKIVAWVKRFKTGGV